MLLRLYSRNLSKLKSDHYIIDLDRYILWFGGKSLIKPYLHGMVNLMESFPMITKRIVVLNLRNCSLVHVE